ncbi:alpha/beta hydrolase [Kitasatospora indigofera]|uniref:alpha/beta hydrolase n=1 Tax=Kitasatospora indigofera TaxID=67307 RepID=UPI0036C830BA
MEHLEELKEFARLHARGQGLAEGPVAALLARIGNDDPGAAGSWAKVWNAQADALLARGRPLEACRHYALARFPHPGGSEPDPERLRAQTASVAAFDRWRRTQPGIERLELTHPEGTLACWTIGLDAPEPKPLLVVMGGIVSVKEQWAQLLPKFAKLGFAAVVTELPGVGENTVPYDERSWRLLPHLLDRLSGRARVDDTSLLTLSFSGHLALRAAVEDTRIRSIHTVGAPVSRFFTDAAWWERVPTVTKETLRRLTGTAGHDELFARLRSWALTPEQLSAVKVPVGYVVSTRDEIIPPAERALLGANLGKVRFKEFDDVHGSPAHLGEMRLWLLHGLLRARGVDDRRTAALGLVLGVQGVVSRLRKTPVHH